MLKSLKVACLVAVVSLTAAGSAKAAFTIQVQSTSGPAFATFNSSSTTGFMDLLDNAPFSGSDLILNYTITNNPGGGFFQINALNFIYNANPNPIGFQVTITESAAAYPAGAGGSVVGFTNYGAFGNVAGNFDSTTTFSGTGANTINFANTPFTAAPFNYTGSTSFVSGGNPGSISILFNVNLPSGGNGNFGTTGGGTGLVGVQDNPVPVPATALLGLFAVPTIAVIRRRMKK